MNSIYKEHGYRDREHYLEALAERYGMGFGEVQMLSNACGPSEDFDVLVEILEDIAQFAN